MARFLAIRLRGPESDADDLVRIVDAVAKAYEEEVIFADDANSAIDARLEGHDCSRSCKKSSRTRCKLLHDFKKEAGTAAGDSVNIKIRAAGSRYADRTGARDQPSAWKSTISRQICRVLASRRFSQLQSVLISSIASTLRALLLSASAGLAIFRGPAGEHDHDCVAVPGSRLSVRSAPLDHRTRVRNDSLRRNCHDAHGSSAPTHAIQFCTFQLEAASCFRRERRSESWVWPSSCDSSSARARPRRSYPIRFAATSRSSSRPLSRPPQLPVRNRPAHSKPAPCCRVASGRSTM